MSHAACECGRRDVGLRIEYEKRTNRRLRITCDDCGRTGPWCESVDVCGLPEDGLLILRQDREAAWDVWDSDHAPDPRLEQAREALRKILADHTERLRLYPTMEDQPHRMRVMGLGAIALAALGGAKEEM